MQLNLTPGEADELRRLIAVALTDLRSEIHHTDTPAYRERLHERERLLADLEVRLGGPEIERAG